MLEASGIRPVLLSGKKVTVTDFGKADHFLIRCRLNKMVVTGLNFAGAALVALQDQIKWVGYLSTTGVYGDHPIAWIDEETPAGLLSERGSDGLRRKRNGRRLVCRCIISGWRGFMAQGVTVYAKRYGTPR